MGYDIIILGHISKDIIVEFQGGESRLLGGALVYSAITAAAAGAKVLAITKAAKEDIPALDFMKSRGNLRLMAIESPASTSILNVFTSEDRERREVTLLSSAQPFAPRDIPLDAQAPLYYLAGLFVGELPDTLIGDFYGKAKIAIDAQGLLRAALPDKTMKFFDWKEKARYLPMVDYFKTDAAEAEILTGLSDRREAAKALADIGRRDDGSAPEIMVTHNTEVLVLAGGEFFAAPFTPSNLSGRTGRGDTTFSSYLAWRKDHGPREAVRFAAALCSIKMEKPGPFSGSLKDVFVRMERDSPR
ncbi:MAG: PfkB domain-containing protein [Spirochaetes bacterium]|nr:MAG: PfkB domain-containing protein [Spirochaetota bacterium]